LNKPQCQRYSSKDTVDKDTVAPDNLEMKFSRDLEFRVDKIESQLFVCD